jgi:hypothetical protein
VPIGTKAAARAFVLDGITGQVIAIEGGWSWSDRSRQDEGRSPVGGRPRANGAPSGT